MSSGPPLPPPVADPQITALQTALQSANSPSDLATVLTTYNTLKSSATLTGDATQNATELANIAIQFIDKVKQQNTRATFITKTDSAEFMRQSIATPLQVKLNGITGMDALTDGLNQVTAAIIRSSQTKPTDSTFPGDKNSDQVDPDVKEKVVSALIPKEDLNTSWDQIVGNEEAKSQFRNAVELPIKIPKLLKFTPKDNRVLLYGPPGTGKTYLIKALATYLLKITGATKYRVFSLQASNILGSLAGESEKTIKGYFTISRFYEGTTRDELLKAKSARSDTQKYTSTRTLLFTDEIEGIAGDRSRMTQASDKRVVTEFIANLDGISKNGFPIDPVAATNFPQDLDIAIRRRFLLAICVRCPTPGNRWELVEYSLTHLSSDDKKIWTETTVQDEKLKWMKLYLDELGKYKKKFVEMTAFFSNSDLANFVTRLLNSTTTIGLPYWWVETSPGSKKWKPTTTLVTDTVHKPVAGQPLENVGDDAVPVDPVPDYVKSILDGLKPASGPLVMLDVEWYDWTKDDTKYTVSNLSVAPAFYQLLRRLIASGATNLQLELVLFIARFLYKYSATAPVDLKKYILNFTMPASTFWAGKDPADIEGLLKDAESITVKSKNELLTTVNDMKGIYSTDLVFTSLASQYDILK